MYSSLKPLFVWAGKTWVGVAVSDSTWLFPAVEAVHIVALAMLFGAILVLDMRLYGVTMKNKPVASVYLELAPWTLASLITILASGAVLFASESMKAYSSGPFQVKMVFLAAAMLFHYTFYRRAAISRKGVSAIVGKLLASVSLVLWLGVGFAGRAIGFF